VTFPHLCFGGGQNGLPALPGVLSASTRLQAELDGEIMETPVQNRKRPSWSFVNQDSISAFIYYRLCLWCGSGDSNPDARRHCPLKTACLPISPLPHAESSATGLPRRLPYQTLLALLASLRLTLQTAPGRDLLPLPAFSPSPSSAPQWAPRERKPESGS
jgi:hypothetical protein